MNFDDVHWCGEESLRIQLIIRGMRDRVIRTTDEIQYRANIRFLTRYLRTFPNPFLLNQQLHHNAIEKLVYNLQYVLTK